MLRLSKRLTEIASLVSAERLIDIGTDHGLLPIYAVEKGIVSRAVGVDRSQMALGQALVNQQRSLLGDRLQFLCSDGLREIHVEEGDCLVLAGMGGTLVQNILTTPKIERCEQIITQANSDQPLVRAFLSQRGWKIERETILQSQKKYYVTISWGKGVEALTAKEVQLGKQLSKERPQLWIDWLHKERSRLQKIESARGKLSSSQIQYLGWLTEEIALD